MRLFTCFLIMIGMLTSSAVMAQDVSLSTNFVDYANNGTLNLSASYGFARHWTANASVKYNPFEFGGGDQPVRRFKQRSASLGLRYWPWNVYSGWWVSSDFRCQEYNMVEAKSQQSYQGDRTGASMGGGYSLMLGKHVNLDMGIGMWAGYDRYSVYECPNCGRKTADGAKSFLALSDILLSISFIF